MSPTLSTFFQRPSPRSASCARSIRPWPSKGRRRSQPAQRRSSSRGSRSAPRCTDNFETRFLINDVAGEIQTALGSTQRASPVTPDHEPFVLVRRPVLPVSSKPAAPPRASRRPANTIGVLGPIVNLNRLAGSRRSLKTPFRPPRGSSRALAFLRCVDRPHAIHRRGAPSRMPRLRQARFHLS